MEKIHYLSGKLTAGEYLAEVGKVIIWFMSRTTVVIEQSTCSADGIATIFVAVM